MVELYYEKSFVRISWDDEIDCTFVEWKGFVYGDEFRAGMNKVLELAREKKATKTLVDLRKMRITSQEDQEWIVKNWTPRAVATGFRYNASLVPETLLAKAAFDATIINTENEIKMMYFDNIEDAKAWLRSVK